VKVKRQLEYAAENQQWHSPDCIVTLEAALATLG
jgi:hypothetical protein